MNLPLQIQNFRLEQALSYAKRGWKVFPAHHAIISADKPPRCSCGKQECSNFAKHPRTEHGFHDASDDEQQIREWWQRWPSANIGLPAGAVNGFVVLDVDPKSGGDETLAKVEAEYGNLPLSVRAVTGGGGAHVYFAHPGIQFPNSVGEDGWLKLRGLDIRGDGGYVVAPPSLHRSGNRYRWEDGQSPEEVPLLPVPEWIMAKLRARMAPKPAPTGNAIRPTSDTVQHWLGKALAKTTMGTRSAVCQWLACQLRDAGISLDEARHAARDYAQRCPQGSEPYTEREAVATVASAYKTPPREPAKSISFASKVIRETAAAKPQPETPAGAAAELRMFYDGVASGKIYNVPFPWDVTTRLSQSLLPGTINCVCGDPGTGKTFWVLDNLRFWHTNGHDAAVYFIEKNREFHMRRLLAQLEKKWDFVDLDWAKSHHSEIKDAIDRHAGLIDELGKQIYSEPMERVTLDSLLNWVRQMASAGKRVMVIDPITAASAGEKRWLADDEFVMAAQKICTAHGASLILITHSKKGNRPGNPTGHDMAAGAAYYRFADSAFWLQKVKKPRKVIYQGRMGPAKGKFSLFLQLHKTRDGAGAGCEIAFALSNGGIYAEQGLVLQEDKSEDIQGEAA